MGVKYSASESSQLMEAMSSNIQVANEVTDRLSRGCDHLIATLDSGELMGAAYTAGKGLFSEIIIPAIKKLKAAVDDIQTELNSYRTADAQVAEYGNLDLEQLKKTKELREQQLASVKKAIEATESFLERMKSIATFNIVSHMDSLVILSSAESQIESQIKELEEKIQKLEFFVAQVSQYFSDSLEVLRLAIQGASQLSQVLVDSNGNHYVDGVDMSWVKKMTDQKIENVKYDSFIASKKLVDEYSNFLKKLEKGLASNDKKFVLEEFLNKNFPGLDEELLSNLITEIVDRVDNQLSNNPTVIKNLLKAGFIWELIKQLKAYSLGLDSPNVGIGINLVTSTTEVVETVNGPELQTNSSTMFSGLLTGGIISTLVAWDYQSQINDGEDVEDAVLKTSGHFGIGIVSAKVGAGIGTFFGPPGSIAGSVIGFVAGTVSSWMGNQVFNEFYDSYVEPVVENVKNYLLDDEKGNPGTESYLNNMGL